MLGKIDISASIVLFNEDPVILQKAVNNFIEAPLKKKLFLIDNSPTNQLEQLASNNNNNVEYIHVGKNIGFGAAHNLVIDKINSDYHLILNPDVEFDSSVFNDLIHQFELNQNLSMVSPKVIYPNGKIQYTCRKKPTIKGLLSRRMGLFKDYVNERQYLNRDLSKSFSPEFIHGCFMLFKTKEFIDLRGFDERYFLYMEDADICRKINTSGKEILYYPKAQITHIHRRGSAKKIKLLFYHTSSAIKYFRKWGFS